MKKKHFKNFTLNTFSYFPYKWTYFYFYVLKDYLEFFKSWKYTFLKIKKLYKYHIFTLTAVMADDPMVLGNPVCIFMYFFYLFQRGIVN